MEKSFISLFMMTPVSGTTSWLPKSRLTVVVREMAMPEASAVTTWEVPCLMFAVLGRWMGSAGGMESSYLRFEGLQPGGIIC